ncbi:hypothetical protein GALMADRAFT_92775 [Galerina marginata CBS 339.88]|uniref:Uncharacterized protein n=1 Tax=Galerina marginata (strain CBS 339.88) TaxID=685588 RepID=A0A067TDH7_GALM3|nr:hypothetical protein GALMADRAFT_92775 [Galerina marginata CBS 339.88]
MSGRSPLSAIFLVHIALEIPIAIQGIWSPANLPFMQLNNTALVLLKLYASLVLASCLTSLLCFNLPEFLPGKRALAIGLCVYHTVCSTVLYQAPRFIPHTFGPTFEAFKVTPELAWGTAHGLVGLGMIIWWQATIPLAQMARAAQRG